MSAHATDSRAEAAARVLEASGLPAARVRAAGPDGEIAVISVPVADWHRLLDPAAAAVIARVKAEGYRYVAIDLDVGAPDG